MMCLTHSPALEGVCKPARSCQSYQGFCENSANVCCVGEFISARLIHVTD